MPRSGTKASKTVSFVRGDGVVSVGARVRAIVTAAAAVTAVAATMLLARPYGANENAAFALLACVLVVAYAIPAVLVSLRQPGNSVGWVLSLISVLFGALAVTAAPVLSDDLRGLDYWNSIVFDGLWAPPIYTLLAVVPLIFPDGSLPSRRWRVVIWGSAIGSTITVLGMPFDPVAAEPLRNLIAQPALAGASGFGVLLGNVSFIAAMVGMVRRFRRARGAERERLKLLVVSVVAAVLLMLSNILVIALYGSPDLPGLVVGILFLLSASTLSAGMSIAILRHRLFDVNVVISKALVFGVLGVVISGLYLAVVVGIGALAGRGSHPSVGLSIAATALAAIIFQPLRVRARRLANRLVYGARATPYEVLAHLSEQLRESFASEDVLSRAAHVLAQGTGARPATVWIAREEDLVPVASWPPDEMQSPLLLRNGELPAFDEHVFGIDVRHDGELLGALTVAKTAADPLRPTEQRLVEDLAAQAGLLLRNARLTAALEARLEELAASRQRLVKAQDEERRRLERDLHDGAQQMLVALKIKLGAAGMMSKEPAVKELLAELQSDTGDALNTLRDLARGIYPPLLASHGLAEALRSQAAKSVVPAEVTADGVPRFAPEVEAAVYFVALEAMQNVQKYARATRVSVEVAANDGRLEFAVTDDGRGFDPATTPPGSGTQNMRDRIAALGGELTMRSAPEAGTKVSGWLPARALELEAPGPAGLETAAPG